jgi:hypothetical protein
MTKALPPNDFRLYWELSRRIAKAPTVTLKDYRALGHSMKGARWMVKQDAAEEAQKPPGETTLDWIAAIEPLSPGEEVLSVYEAAIAFRDRCHLPKPKRVEDIEHWLGRPYQLELPDRLSVTFNELPPETEDERNRRISWEVACELLGDIAGGNIPTVSGRQVGGTPYGQVIRTTDFLLWAKARGGYGEVVSKLLARHESQETEEGRVEPLRKSNERPLYGKELDEALDKWARGQWGEDMKMLPGRDALLLLARARSEFSKAGQQDIRGLRGRLAPDEIKRGGGGMHRRSKLGK